MVPAVDVAIAPKKHNCSELVFNQSLKQRYLPLMSWIASWLNGTGVLSVRIARLGRTLRISTDCVICILGLDRIVLKRPARKLKFAASEASRQPFSLIPDKSHVGDLEVLKAVTDFVDHLGKAKVALVLRVQLLNLNSRGKQKFRLTGSR